MKFEFNDGFLLAGGKVIAEINALEENSIDTLFDSKKNELREKYETLLKDYALASHECEQKDKYIKELEEKQEKLLKELLAMKSEVENVRGENKHILESYKDSEEKLFTIKEIISGK